MSVHRIMGIETEYGILAPADPGASPMLLSGLVVSAYGSSVGLHPRTSGWDYHDENPLADARGFVVERQQAHASQLTDEFDDDVTTSNVVLTNGARFYVDHAHPEYSSPEVTNPLDAVRYDLAGERILTKAAELASAMSQHGQIRVYKNNTDNKGASYGTHENYLMPRTTPFANIVHGLLPFFATRLLYTGNGRVGLGVNGEQAGYQLSQRADFMEVEVALETTLRRPLVNTRDEPHAEPDHWRRLHVIVGDATRSHTATFLKMGATALVLGLIENNLVPDLAFRNPVSALHTFSRDVTCTATAELTDGRSVTALDVQWAYYEAAAAMVDQRNEEDPGDVTALTLRTWHDVLRDLARDPALTSDRLEWVSKLQLLRGYRDRDGLDWNSPRLELIDLQYADMTRGKGLYERLESRGKVATLIDDADSAVTEPPTDTRAYFRGECVRKYGRQVVSASWDSVVLSVAGSDQLQRIPMMDPHRGSAKHVADLLRDSDSPAELLASLRG